MYIICLYINSECMIRMAHIIPTRWDMGPHGPIQLAKVFFSNCTRRTPCTGTAGPADQPQEETCQ